jgi:hypothetical protein
VVIAGVFSNFPNKMPKILGKLECLDKAKSRGFFCQHRSVAVQFSPLWQAAIRNWVMWTDGWAEPATWENLDILFGKLAQEVANTRPFGK